MQANKEDDQIKMRSSQYSQQYFHEQIHSESTKNSSTWEISQEYEKYKNIILEELKDKQLLMKDILTNVGAQDTGIHITMTFIQQLQVNILLMDMQSMLVELTWGYFKLNLSVFIINLQFYQLHSDEIIQKGSYGQIYNLRFQNKSYIIKFLHFQKQKHEFLKNVYSEYFINKIAGVLNIAPKVHNLFGYDIVLYKNGAIFVEELCYPIEQYIDDNSHIDIALFEKHMKQNLRILHMMNICHFDIKPKNVVWSQKLNRILLIDFGLSKFIGQKIGYLSNTFFKGTYHYCSQDMKKLYFLKSSKKIDLYYNDAVGLLSTMTKLKQRLSAKLQQSSNSKKISIDHEQQQQMSSFKTMINFLRIKYKFFIRNYSQSFRLMMGEQYFQESIYKFFITKIYGKQQKILNQTQLNSYKQKLQKKIEIKKYGNDYSHLDKIYLNAHQDMGMELNNMDLEELINNAIISKQLLISQPFLVCIINYLFNTLKECASAVTSLKVSKFVNKLYGQFKNNHIFSQQIQNRSSKLVSLLCHFLNYFIPLQNKEMLLKLRQIFINVEEFSQCFIIQDIIVNLPQLQQSYQYYFLRLQFQLERISWPSNIYFFGNKKWFNKNKDQNDADQVRKQLKTVTQLILIQKNNQQMINIKKASKIMKDLLSKNSEYKNKLGVYQKKKIEQLINIIQIILEEYQKNKLIYKKSYPIKKTEQLQEIQLTQYEYFMSIKQLYITGQKKQKKKFCLSGTRYYNRLEQKKVISEIKKQLSQIRNIYQQNPLLFFLHIEHILAIYILKQIQLNNEILKCYINLMQTYKGFNQASTIRLDIIKLIFNKQCNKYLCEKQKYLKGLIVYTDPQIDLESIFGFFSTSLFILKNNIKEIENNQKMKVKLNRSGVVIQQTLQMYLHKGFQKCYEHIFTFMNTSKLQSLSMGQSYISMKGLINFVRNLYYLIDADTQTKYQELYMSIFNYFHSIQCSEMFLQLLMIQPIIKKCLTVESSINKNFQLILEVLLNQNHSRDTTMERQKTTLQGKIYQITQILVSKSKLSNLIRIRDKIYQIIKMDQIKSHYCLSIFIFAIFGSLEIETSKHFVGMDQQQYKLAHKMKKKLIILCMLGISQIYHQKLSHTMKSNLYCLYQSLQKIKSHRKLLRIKKQKLKSFYISSSPLNSIEISQQQILELINKKIKNTSGISNRMFLNVIKRINDMKNNYTL